MRRVLFDIIEINIAVSIVILFLCLFAGKLRKRYSAEWMKLVWILLAVRLLIPYNFSLPFTEIRLLNFPGFEQEESILENDTQTNEPRMEVSEIVQNESEIVVQENPEIQNENSEVQKKKPFLVTIWLLGLGICLVYYVINYFIFYRKCQKSMQPIIDEQLEDQVCSLQRIYIEKDNIPIYQSRTISCPMLIGVFCPKLVLPAFKKWERKELELVVAHELWHYKRKDLWLKILMMAVCCLNWFNPLVFVMKKQFFYDMELACDNSVLKNRNGEERETYARIMLSFAGNASKVPTFSTSFWDSKDRMKERIDYMMDMGRKRKGIVSIVITMLFVVMISLLVSCGYKPEEMGDGETSVSWMEEETSVNRVEEDTQPEESIGEETLASDPLIDNDVPVFNFYASDDNGIRMFCNDVCDFVEDCLAVEPIGSEPEYMDHFIIVHGSTQVVFRPTENVTNYDRSTFFNELYVFLNALSLEDNQKELTEVSDPEVTLESLDQEAIDYYLSIQPECTFQTEDGMEYRMIGIDRAAGSSYYALIGTYDGGKTCAFFNCNPYNGSGGTAMWLDFLDENLGFSCLAYSGGTYGSLYRTEDGGKSFAEIMYPSSNILLSDGTYYNPFVMPEKIYEEDGKLYMLVGQGPDGDYYGENGERNGLYVSENLGKTWEYVGER